MLKQFYVLSTRIMDTKHQDHRSRVRTDFKWLIIVVKKQKK